MEITVLIKNHARSGYIIEHSVSYLIELEDENILFNTRHIDIFIKNVKTLGINIKKQFTRLFLTMVIGITNTLQYLDNKTLNTKSGCLDNEVNIANRDLRSDTRFKN